MLHTKSPGSYVAFAQGLPDPGLGLFFHALCLFQKKGHTEAPG